MTKHETGKYPSTQRPQVETPAAARGGHVRAGAEESSLAGWALLVLRDTETKGKAMSRRFKPKRTNAQWGKDPRVNRARLAAVRELRQRGYSYKEIAVALYVTPWRVRMLEAKAIRLTQCTCPAEYDHTVMGHLPDCPHNSL